MFLLLAALAIAPVPKPDYSKLVCGLKYAPGASDQAKKDLDEAKLKAKCPK